jgi:hypothetical protein
MSIRRLFAALVVCSIVSGLVPAPAHAATLTDVQVSLGQLQMVLQQLLRERAPLVKGVNTLVVTTDTELASAIKGATGGETIQLAPGTYGALALTGGTYNQLLVGTVKIAKGIPTLSAPVTITSQDVTHPAVVPTIAVRSTDHWHFKGLAVRPVRTGAYPSPAVALTGGDNSIEDSTITYGDATDWTAADWVAKTGNGISINGAGSVVKNNYLKNVYMGIEVGKNATGALVKNNTVDGVGGDGMRVLADNAIVDSNFFKNFKKINDNHDDCSQSWGMATTTVNQDASVRGVTFQNNICLNNENPSDPLYDTGLQGFDDFDGGTEGWTVQNNVFAGTAYHGLSYYGAVNMSIRNNTILDSDSVVNGVDNVWIRVSANKTGTIQPTGNTFQNNIANKFAGYGSSSVVTNSKVVKMADYDKYFRDWRHGDMRLLASSPIQGAGANLDPATVGSTMVVMTIMPVVAPVATTTAPTATTTTATSTTDSGDTVTNDSGVDAPTVTLDISTTSIIVGSKITLTWSTVNASSCLAKGGWGGKKALNGSQTTQAYTATGTQNFILTCIGAGGSATGRARLTIESDGSESTSTATSTASSTEPVGNQAEIAKLLQILAMLQKQLAAILAHRK